MMNDKSLSLDIFTDKFSINNHLYFEELDSGIILAKIDNEYATATISLYGGHIIAWQPKSQKFPVLWLSDLAQFKPGKAIRGGVPVCWPWFGANSIFSESPSHGYARISNWTVTSVSLTETGETEIFMVMGDSEYNRSQFGIAATLSLRIFIGSCLSIELTTTNTGLEALIFTEALHTYFFVGAISQIKINGLSGCQYADLLDSNSLKSESVPIRFNEEFSRAYLDTTVDCVIEDSSLARTIRIAKTGSQSTVVWNPWMDTAKKMDDLGPAGWQTMVCVESGNALENKVKLNAGASHTLSVKYSVNKMAI